MLASHSTSLHMVTAIDGKAENSAILCDIACWPPTNLPTAQARLSSPERPNLPIMRPLLKHSVILLVACLNIARETKTMWPLLKHLLVLLLAISALTCAIAGLIQLTRAGYLIPAPPYNIAWQICDAVRDVQHPEHQMWLQWRHYDRYVEARASLLRNALGASSLAMGCFLVAVVLADWDDGHTVWKTMIGTLLFLEVLLANDMCWSAGGW